MSGFRPQRTEGIMSLTQRARGVLSGTVITVSMFIQGALNSDIYLSLLRDGCPFLNLHPDGVGN